MRTFKHTHIRSKRLISQWKHTTRHTHTYSYTHKTSRHNQASQYKETTSPKISDPANALPLTIRIDGFTYANGRETRPGMSTPTASILCCLDHSFITDFTYRVQFCGKWWLTFTLRSGWWRKREPGEPGQKGNIMTKDKEIPRFREYTHLPKWLQT